MTKSSLVHHCPRKTDSLRGQVALCLLVLMFVSACSPVFGAGNEDALSTVDGSDAAKRPWLRAMDVALIGKVGGMKVSIDPEGTEIEVIHELVDFSGKKVLEVGCGDGRMTRRYADRVAFVLALDPNAEKIERAIDSTPEPFRSKVRFRVADIADAELAQQAFEVAILSHSL
jgi:2-polyprenyl-3-methyl-5-hydroxy-6-metoxy-1,4-benzoquinol methylase